MSSFHVGSKVRAQWKGYDAYYGGSISKVNGDNTFDILYDDGDKEQNIPLPRIQAIYKVGDNIEGQWREKGTWVDGTISKVHTNTGELMYDIKYANRASATKVSSELIRPIIKPSNTSTQGLTCGAKVEFRHRSDRYWCPGKILDVHGNLFDVEYDLLGNTYKEKNASLNRIHLLSSADESESMDPLAVPGTAVPPATGGTAKFSPGDKVEADWRGTGLYQPAKIRSVNTNGKSRSTARSVAFLIDDRINSGSPTGTVYDVDYDAGDQELQVPESRIRWPSVTSSTNIGSGDSSGGGISNSASNSSSRRERRIHPFPPATSFTIDSARNSFSSGSSSATSSSSSGNSNRPPPSYSSSTAAAATTAMRNSTTAATVTGCGTSSWSATTAAAVEEHHSGTSPSAVFLTGSFDRRGAFLVGSEVEGDWGGLGEWHPATIRVAHDDGTFNLDYQSGDKEYRVARSRLRWPPHVVHEATTTSGNRSSAHSQAHSSSSSPLHQILALEDLVVGAPVEGNWSSSGQWYRGTIRKVCVDDGSYDIDYEDGDREYRVPLSRIRWQHTATYASSSGRGGSSGSGGSSHKSAGVTSSSSSSSKPYKKLDPSNLSVGMGVEGNWSNRGVWCDGIIRNAYFDGTYDIDYEDGDREYRVPIGRIRL
mmetsp:Transcript_1109/g.1840  ORF Transcript_1109/g.1840 Transcript_1109/m.1840 type:complete len:652 (+) Transcript_1109:49-2004(+)